MNRYVGLSGMLVGMLSSVVLGANSPSDLPKISAVANFLGTMPQGQSPQFHVSEIELGIQHYVYADVQANVFIGLHKEDSGETAVELEEAFLTFSDFFGTLAPDWQWPVIETILGQKKLPIGKWNQQHPEQRPFVDAPLTQELLIGGEEGLRGEGAQVSAVLPLPFFSRLSVGAWQIPPSEAEVGPVYGSPMVGVRSWNSLALSDDTEIELGLNGFTGSSTASQLNQQSILGTDLTVTQALGKQSFLKNMSEWFRVDYAAPEAGTRQPQFGLTSTLLYQPTAGYQLGGRYDWVGRHSEEETDQSRIALFATRILSDTAKLRLQFNVDQDHSSTVFLQCLVVLGPHSHAIN